jgi:hypothetical protein
VTRAEAKPIKYLYRRTVKGHLYVYFRGPDGKLIPLPADEDSAEFKRSYDACIEALSSNPRPAPSAAKPKQLANVAFIGGTIGQAIEVYLASSTFKQNKVTTQHRYRISLDHMRDRIGTARLADLDIDGVDIYSEQLTNETGPASADFHVSLLHNIWQVCRKFPEFGIKNRPDPTRDAEQRYTKVKRPHKPWNDEAQDRFMETAPETLKLAKLLLHFSAQRGGDCVKMK